MDKPELKHIVVFEHQRLLVNQGEQYLSSEQYRALVNHYGNYSPFYSLIRSGVQFRQYVGALQIGDTLIEILPKADDSNDKVMWQNLLVNMIRSIWSFPVKQAGNSHLRTRHNSVLDLYFELFVDEIETLLRRGLIKKYINEERNAKALKGKLAITKHVQKNIVHKERFYIRASNYKVDHELHQILYCTLQLLSRLNRDNMLSSRIGNLMLNFPEQSPVKVTHLTFDRIRYDRKTIVYKKSVAIAKLLLLNYHPDLSKGRNNVLALMFDMDILWERFVLHLLRKSMKDFKVSGQLSKKFWEGHSIRSTMRPDIVLTHIKSNKTIILDTKWKNLKGRPPSSHDLRQMYVYNEYFKAKHGVLIYPGEAGNISGQFYLKDQTGLDNKFCHILQISPSTDFNVWQDSISSAVLHLMDW